MLSVMPANCVGQPRLAAVRELPADLETPVSLYLKLRNEVPSYLLESVEGGEHLGRYSFIGLQPSRILTSWRGRAQLVQEGHEHDIPLAGRDVLDIVRELLRDGPSDAALVPAVAPGAVGYLGYDVVRDIERLPATAGPGLGLPEAIMIFCDVTLILDHVKHKMWIIGQAPVGESATAARAVASTRVDDAIARLRLPVPLEHPAVAASTEARSNVTRERYEDMVRRAKEHIAAGDIFQVVLSQCLARPTVASPFTIYRALRRLNPSPYMFYLDLPGDLHLIGSSPEVLVRLHGRQAEQRPLAGTRRRGLDDSGDMALADELLADPKERAEHVMLVDLARNDLGRVCRFGSVSVPSLMGIERYSHVMHIVSNVEGQVRAGCDAFDVLRACSG